MAVLPLVTAVCLQSVIQGSGPIDRFWTSRPMPVAQSVSSGSEVRDCCLPGDLDGDAVPDYVVVEVPSGALSTSPIDAVAISGDDGQVIWRAVIGEERDKPGTSMAGGADFDGDGVPDIVVGSYRARGPAPWSYPDYGEVRVLSGADGALLHRIPGREYRDFLGTAVACIDDLDGDGVDDFLASATQSGQGPVPGNATGFVTAYSGADGRRLYEVWGAPTQDSEFGRAMLVLDDHDGDGIRDFVVSAPRHAPASLGPSYGLISLHSGADGRELTAIRGPGGGTIGWALAPLDDLDGDGHREVAVSQQQFPGWMPTDPGRVLAYSLPGKQRVWTASGDIGDDFGSALGSTPDVDGDGVAELLVGAPGAPGAGSLGNGRIHLRSGSDGGTLNVWAGSPASGVTLSTGRRAGRGTTDPVSGRAVLLLPFPEWGVTRYHALEHSPGVSVSPPQLSLSTLPASVDIGIDFPATEAGYPYHVLLSTASEPGTQVLGLALPVGTSPLLTLTMLDRIPGLSGATGLLDANGDATATLSVPASVPPASAGRTVHACAVSRAGVLGRSATLAATLVLVP